MLLNSETTVDGSDSEENDHEATKQIEVSCCLTVTHVPQGVFNDGKLKELFEEIFRRYGEISVIYLKSFRRARVIYNDEMEASIAKINLHGSSFSDSQLGVYFTQVPNFPQTTPTSLQLPPPEKQFLISPPASPPVNWAPAPEATPVINHDLIEAVARLQPNEPYEAHPPSDTQGHPSITVHWCEDDEEEEKKEHPLRSQPRHLVQTHKPPDTHPAQQH